jgi:two-component system nitrogen regulation sensor histidine kinase NtrY
MASDLNRAAGALEQDKTKFTTFLTAQAALRSIPMALLIDENGNLITAAQTKRQIPMQPPPKEAFEAVKEGQPVIMTLGGQAQIRSLLKLDEFDGVYLYTAKKVDPQIVEHLAKTDIAMREYNSLESQRFEAQLTFALIYIGIALVLLLAAIWFGLGLANGLASPIGQLIVASKRVSSGKLDTRVDIDGSDEDINRLGHTFNQMTEQLSKQRKDLIDARDDLSRRHNFTEMVLTGISSGVIGLDEDGKINHANLLAQDICGVNEFNMVGRPIDEVLPAFSNLLIVADSKISRAVEIELKDDDGNRRVLLVRVAKGRAGNEKNYVITFEDVTNLISAQRTAAWADIARRIAHEIKNPLTPIQLSAERLKSKYEDEVSSDPEIFKQCTETIIRQVGDIGRMVDEFSSFARMPSVVFKNFDIRDAVNQTVFLQRVAHPEIEYIFECEENGEMPINADSRLISQALTNILKNSAESIYRNKERVESKILVTLRQEEGVISIDVADTGIGLPDINREALLEPYITTRDQGTGLGLAIVKKVMTDHGGEITLGDAPWVRDGRSGAQITLSFPSIKREKVGHSKVEEVI